MGDCLVRYIILNLDGHAVAVSRSYYQQIFRLYQVDAGLNDHVDIERRIAQTYRARLAHRRSNFVQA